ncbi:DUF134 domain-containing protein [bacterium]|nr:DUF134 domain-containing protein [bacterium]
MPRRKRCRKLHSPPLYQGFKPKGVPARLIKKVTLHLEEYEAVKLADYDGLEHEEASLKMEISRSVFTRMLQDARKKIATAIVEGLELVISGGDYYFEKKSFRCKDCNSIYHFEHSEKNLIECEKCGSTNIELINEMFDGSL